MEVNFKAKPTWPLLQVCPTNLPSPKLTGRRNGGSEQVVALKAEANAVTSMREKEEKYFHLVFRKKKPHFITKDF